MAVFVLVIALAFVLGFAAHRASVCTVRGVAEIMSVRTGHMFGSIAKTMLWVALLILPFLLLMPYATTAYRGWTLTGQALFGGFLFGVGAAINGACAYSTMARLVDGEGRMVATIAGFALGVAAFAVFVDVQWAGPPTPSRLLIDTVPGWLFILLVPGLFWALYEAMRLWRTRPAGVSFSSLLLAPQYRLSSAAMLIGLTGAAIYLLYGSAGYTSTYQVIIEAALGIGAAPPTARWVLLLSVLGGMFVSTVQRGSFRIRWKMRRSWTRNILGGTMMGLGTALAPGGNDVLILYSIPTLSPHALPAFLAMTAGIVGALWSMRTWLGIDMRVRCENDLFISDSQSPPTPQAPPRG